MAAGRGYITIVHLDVDGVEVFQVKFDFVCNFSISRM